MKTTKTLAWVVALSAAASGFLSCTQPPAACQVGLAGSGYGFATKFTLTTAPQGCPTGFTPQLGDIIGMEAYHPQGAGPDGSTTYNPDITTMAMQADTLGNEVRVYGSAGADPSSGLGKPDQAYAFGTFVNANPDANNQCPVGPIAPAVQKLQAVAASSLPADSVEYAWSNVSVYVTAADQGTQFAGDLTITDNACVVTYHAVGLWPGVSCTGFNGMPNADLCNPCAEPSLKRPVGSGISPDAQTTCVQLFSETDPYKSTYVYQSCALDSDCAGVSTSFVSACIGAMAASGSTPAVPGSCTFCQDNFDCGPASSCISPPGGSGDQQRGGFCYNRAPYFCVLAGTADPPVLNPSPPTCESSGGGGSSP